MTINANANRQTVEADINADAQALAQDAIEKARLRAEIQDKLERNPAVVDLLNRQAWAFTEHVDGDIQHKNVTAKEMVVPMDDVSVQALKDLSTRLDEISNCLNSAPEKGFACFAFQSSAQEPAVTAPQADIDATFSAASETSEWEAETAKPELGAGVAQVLASSHETSVPETDDYTVKAGDSLWKIAQNRGVAPSDFADFRDQVATINGLENPDLIKPGMTLFIPEQQDVVAKVEASGPVATAPEQTPAKITDVMDAAMVDLPTYQLAAPSDDYDVTREIDVNPKGAKFTAKPGDTLSHAADCYYEHVDFSRATDLEGVELMKAQTELVAKYNGQEENLGLIAGKEYALPPTGWIEEQLEQGYQPHDELWAQKGTTADNRALKDDCSVCTAPVVSNTGGGVAAMKI